MKLSIFAHYLTRPPSYRDAAGIPDKKVTTAPVAAQFFVANSDKNKSRDGRFIIRIAPGYIFNGASIPRCLWSICGHPWQYPRVPAALIHDWLYDSKAFPRLYADLVYKSLLENLGFPTWKATLEFFAIRFFGIFAWRRAKTEAQMRAFRYGWAGNAKEEREQ